MNISRTALIIGTLLLPLALSACDGVSTSISSCVQDVCTVSLNGAGDEAEVNEEETTVRFVESDGTEAIFELEGVSSTCTRGQTLDLPSYEVTCTKVSESGLNLKMTKAQ